MLDEDGAEAQTIRNQLIQLEQNLELFQASRQLRQLTLYATEMVAALEEYAPEEAEDLHSHLSPTLASSQRKFERWKTALESQETPKQPSDGSDAESKEFQDQLDQQFELLELTEELVWAFEEQKHRAAEELLEELRHILNRRASDKAANRSDAPTSGLPSSPDSTWLPVEVTDAELDQVRGTSFRDELVPLLKNVLRELPQSKRIVGRPGSGNFNRPATLGAAPPQVDQCH